MGAQGAQNLPGLRAGSYRFTDTSMTVRRAVYIPGVVVSGKLNETRSHVLAGLLHVSVRGQRSLSGTVRVDRHGGLRARLGRVTVTVTPRAHAAGATDGFRSLPRVRLPLRLR
jgi:hypothetical protein